jgi:hypothetical protein
MYFGMIKTSLLCFYHPKMQGYFYIVNKPIGTEWQAIVRILARMAIERGLNEKQ